MITLLTATLGRVTFTVHGDRDRFNDPKSLTCHIVSHPFEFRFGGIEYTCTAVIGQYRSSRGLEPLRLEQLAMTRKTGGGPTDNARSAAWQEMSEFVELMRRLETWEEIWGLACMDAFESTDRDIVRAIEDLERKREIAANEREAYGRMSQEPPASCVA